MRDGGDRPPQVGYRVHWLSPAERTVATGAADTGEGHGRWVSAKSPSGPRPSTRASSARRRSDPRPASTATMSLVSPISARGTVTTASWMSRSEEHTSELQSLMRISYAVFCLKKQNQQH